jgi:hypothetical protein
MALDCSGCTRRLLNRRQPLWQFWRGARRDRSRPRQLETTIADLITGQHCDPLRVVMFNTDANRAEDVSHAIAQEILRRLGLEGRNVPSVLEDFIDGHVGPDRQLTLRLAAV